MHGDRGRPARRLRTRVRRPRRGGRAADRHRTSAGPPHPPRGSRATGCSTSRRRPTRGRSSRVRGGLANAPQVDVGAVAAVGRACREREHRPVRRVGGRLAHDHDVADDRERGRRGLRLGPDGDCAARRATPRRRRPSATTSVGAAPLAGLGRRSDACRGADADGGRRCSASGQASGTPATATDAALVRRRRHASADDSAGAVTPASARERWNGAWPVARARRRSTRRWLARLGDVAAAVRRGAADVAGRPTAHRRRHRDDVEAAARRLLVEVRHDDKLRLRRDRRTVCGVVRTVGRWRGAAARRSARSRARLRGADLIDRWRS